MLNCPRCQAPIIPNWRWPGRVRRDPSRYLYAVRRRLCLPRNYVIAENWRRFWRREHDAMWSDWGPL